MIGICARTPPGEAPFATGFGLPHQEYILCGTQADLAHTLNIFYEKKSTFWKSWHPQKMGPKGGNWIAKWCLDLKEYSITLPADIKNLISLFPWACDPLSVICYTTVSVWIRRAHQAAFSSHSKIHYIRAHPLATDEMKIHKLTSVFHG